jgi:hypothetical protein
VIQQKMLEVQWKMLAAVNKTRGEGSATGPNGETSTEAAGKTYKDEVSVDGTGHTSVGISVKLDLGRMRKPHSYWESNMDNCVQSLLQSNCQ